MGFFYNITNKFIQTYSSIELTYLPIILDDLQLEVIDYEDSDDSDDDDNDDKSINNLPPTIQQLYDSDVLINNIDSGKIIGYLKVRDIFNNSDILFKNLLKTFNLKPHDSIYFIKFTKIIFFNNSYQIDFTKNNDELNNVMYAVKKSNNVETIIAKIKNNENFNDCVTSNNVNNDNKIKKRKYIFAKWSPCLQLIQKINNEDKELCEIKNFGKLIQKHYNTCDDCVKEFNTIATIDNIDTPFCFTKYNNEPIIASNLIDCFSNNLEYFEKDNVDFKVVDGVTNLIYITESSEFNDNTIFILP